MSSASWVYFRILSGLGYAHPLSPSTIAPCTSALKERCTAFLGCLGIPQASYSALRARIEGLGEPFRSAAKLPSMRSNSSKLSKYIRCIRSVLGKGRSFLSSWQSRRRLLVLPLALLTTERWTACARLTEFLNPMGKTRDTKKWRSVCPRCRWVGTALLKPRNFCHAAGTLKM